MARARLYLLRGPQGYGECWLHVQVCDAHMPQRSRMHACPSRRVEDHFVEKGSIEARNLGLLRKVPRDVSRRGMRRMKCIVSTHHTQPLQEQCALCFNSTPESMEIHHAPIERH